MLSATMAIVCLAALPTQTEGLKSAARFSFETQQDITGFRLGQRAKITNSPGEVSAGQGSLKCDTASSPGGWHTLLSANVKVRRNEPVLVSFKYRILNQEDKAFVCHFWHSKSLGGPADRGVLRWRAANSDESLYAGNVFGLPREGEIKALVFLGDADDYELKLAVHGKATVVIDDLNIFNIPANGSPAHAPALLFPGDGTTLSPEAVQLVWSAVPPAIRYRVQLSRNAAFRPGRTFELQSARQRHNCRRWRDRGRMWFTNFFDEETVFAPTGLEEGRWFWRVRARHGEWSSTRSFLVRSAKSANGSSIRIGPKNPLLILYWHHGPTIDRDWAVVPADIRGRCALRVRMGKYYSRRPDYEEVLNSLQRSGARGLVQVVQWNIAALPLPLIEHIFNSYPAVAGVFVAEYTEGMIYYGCPIRRFRQREEYLRRLVMLTKRYGKMLFLAEKNNFHERPFVRLGGDRVLMSTLEAARDNVCLMWKQNSPIAPYLTHASVLGLWFAGACRNWGVATEAWYWFDAGFGRLNEVPRGDRVRPTDYRLMPPSFLGTMMLLGAASGATVYQLECPVPIHRGRLVEAAQDVVIPLFRRLVQWSLVPTQEEVRRQMPVAYLASKGDVQWSGRTSDQSWHGGDWHYGRLKPLFASAYGGMSYFAQMIPRGPRPFVPVLPVLASPVTRRLFPTVLTARDLLDAPRLTRVFVHPDAARRIRGDAFCAQIGRCIYACNPWENWDKPSWFEVPLEKPFTSMRGELSVHSWLIGVQTKGKLMLHLSGRRERTTSLQVQAQVPLEVRSRPPHAALADLGQRRTTANISVSHKDRWCDVVITMRD